MVPANLALEDKPAPTIEIPTDAIIKITKTTICGTDLHIIKGDVHTVTEGRILGHEGVGIIEQIGANVSNFYIGDHVLISCISSCGKCSNCKKGMYSHCENGGGWVLGNLIDGTQAEYVRIPFADNSLYPILAGADEEALVMLSDILPPGFECGVLSGQVKPGDTVAIVGGGPIGLATLLTAQIYSPAEIIMIDIDDNRLEIAKKFGATKVINNSDGTAIEKVMALTGNRGVDVAIEAIGLPLSFDIWSHNITLTTRLVDTVTTPMLLKTVMSGKVQPNQLITHHFELNDIMQAYKTFGNAETRTERHHYKQFVRQKLKWSWRSTHAPSGTLTNLNKRRNSHVRNNFDCRRDFDACGYTAHLASQPSVGLLSEWWTWFDLSYSDHPVTDW